jgi:hypothetical protein
MNSVITLLPKPSKDAKRKLQADIAHDHGCKNIIK